MSGPIGQWDNKLAEGMVPLDQERACFEEYEQEMVEAPTPGQQRPQVQSETDCHTR